jgi:hypothetical protein
LDDIGRFFYGNAIMVESDLAELERKLKGGVAALGRGPVHTKSTLSEVRKRVPLHGIRCGIYETKY